MSRALFRLREELAFTLIELMVVVMIIAILIAIAIPVFMGARRRAQDRAAQASLRIAATAAKTLFTDKEDYAAATQAALSSTEPSLIFRDSTSDSTDATTVSVSAANATEFVGASYSKAGNCWFVRDVAGPGSTTIGGTYWNRKDSTDGSGCQANNVPPETDSNWHRNLTDVV